MKYALVLLPMLALSGPVAADYTVTWQWDSPTERVNGEPYDSATETDRYELHCGRQDATELYIAQAPGGTNELSVDMADRLTDFGRHDCVMRVVDNDGLVSDWSEPQRYVYNAAPGAPGRLRF